MDLDEAALAAQEIVNIRRGQQLIDWLDRSDIDDDEVMQGAWRG